MLPGSDESFLPTALTRLRAQLRTEPAADRTEPTAARTPEAALLTVERARLTTLAPIERAFFTGEKLVTLRIIGDAIDLTLLTTGLATFLTVFETLFTAEVTLEVTFDAWALMNLRK